VDTEALMHDIVCFSQCIIMELAQVDASDDNTPQKGKWLLIRHANLDQGKPTKSANYFTCLSDE